jgi:hypothetical protein
MSERDFRKVDVFDHDTRSDCYGMVRTETEVDTEKWGDGTLRWAGGEYVEVEDYRQAVDEIDRLRKMVQDREILLDIHQNERSRLEKENDALRARVRDLEDRLAPVMNIKEGD